MTPPSLAGLPQPDGTSARAPFGAAAEKASPAAPLRDLLVHSLGGTVLQDALSECQRLQDRIEVTGAEADGLSCELLRAYEHLGIVFQLTRQVSALRSEREVLDLFLGSLRTAYPADQLRLVFLDGPSEAKDGTILEKHYLQTARQCRAEHRLLVENSDAARGGVLQRISAPVFCAEDFVCAIQVERAVSATAASPPTNEAAVPTPLDSGDMLLFDSLAAFCGDLLHNFRLLEALRQASIDTVRALVSAVDQKDPYTSGHSNRVGYYATLLGRELGLDDKQLRLLHKSALLHDVGKIGIRDDVLKKVGRLTPEEMDHMREHPRRGYEVVRSMPHFAECLDGVLYHHEHYGGGGYPTGLAGEAIPFQARCVQIADVFDALTSTRSYRKAFSWQEAVKVMRSEAGTTLDPRLAETFDRLLQKLFARHPAGFDEIGKGMAVPRLDGEAGPLC